MKNMNILPILGALAIPTILALRAPADNLSFAPGPAVEVRMVFDNELEFFLDDLSAELKGEDLVGGLGEIDLSVSVSLNAAFTDKYASVSEGAPQQFSRHFGNANLAGELALGILGESHIQSHELEGSMLGLTVNFAWDEKAAEYTATYPEDEEGDPELLDDLVARTDLAFILPPGEVAVDSEWEIDPLGLAELLLPGGDLGYSTEIEGLRSTEAKAFRTEFQDQTTPVLRSLMASGVTGTYKGINAEGLAEIAISLDIDSSRDFSDLALKLFEGLLVAEGNGGGPSDTLPTIDFSEVALRVEGEGLLLWDPTAGHVATFTMSTGMELEITLEMHGDSAGMPESFSANVIFGGNAEVSLTAQP